MERGKRADGPPGANDTEASSQSSSSFLKKLWPFSSQVSQPSLQASKESTHLFFSLVPCLEKSIFQANLGSFTGFYGPRVQRNAYELLKIGAYTALASDLHESRNAAEVLVQDKFDNNPFLQKLAEFNGVAPEIQKTVKTGEGEQIGLF